MNPSVRRHIQSARRIFVAGGSGFPETLVAQLDEEPDLLAGKEVTCSFIPGFGHLPPRVPHGRLEVFFGARKLLDRPEVCFVPMQYRRIWNRIKTQGFDLALLRLASDTDGGLHFGMGVDFQPAALEVSARVVAEVTAGAPFVRDAPPVRCQPVLQEASPAVGKPRVCTRESMDADVARRIGENVATLIRDGDCLQLGIGAIPEAVLGALLHHRDLGCHSGMITKGVAQLFDSGVLSGAKKTVDRGKIVTGFVLGDAHLERWAAECGALALRPVRYTHDAKVLASMERFVAINSAIEVDLLGQANAEMIGGKQFSGVGGAVDFVRGAGLSTGGRSIVAMPSTARGGTVSRIVRGLGPMNCTTLLRTDIDFVVTEHGVAKLVGSDVGERSENLAAIADPGFRESLLQGMS